MSQRTAVHLRRRQSEQARAFAIDVDQPLGVVCDQDAFLDRLRRRTQDLLLPLRGVRLDDELGAQTIPLARVRDDDDPTVALDSRGDTNADLAREGDPIGGESGDVERAFTRREDPEEGFAFVLARVGPGDQGRRLLSYGVPVEPEELEEMRVRPADPAVGARLEDGVRQRVENVLELQPLAELVRSPGDPWLLVGTMGGRSGDLVAILAISQGTPSPRPRREAPRPSFSPLIIPLSVLRTQSSSSILL